MAQYLFGIAGIAVSLGLFLLGYRQTIGAKKERVRTANAEIEKIFVRRIVLEEYAPRVEDIARVIDGKARDFRVRHTDLLSEGQFVNNIFTRVVETDFIPREQREHILERLSLVIAEAEEEPVLEEALEELPSPGRSKTIATISMAIMGALASLIGAILTTLPKISGLEARFSDLLPMALTAAASLTIISFLIVIYRVREKQQEETSKQSALSDYVDFERAVLKALTKAGLGARAAGSLDPGYDLVVERGDRKILLEVKAWKRPMPARVVSMVVDRLREALSRHQATEAILVTSTKVPVSNALAEDPRIKLMSLPELRNYLVHLARD